MRLRTLLALHRLVLRCYPASFRKRTGTQVLRLATRRLGGAIRGPGSALWAWVGTLLDLGLNLLPAWLDEGSKRHGTSNTKRRWGVKPGLVAISFKRSIRRIRRSPGFSAAVVLAIGISVGATAGVVAIVKAAFAPLPYENPASLVLMTETSQGDRISTSYPNYRDWKEGLASFSDLAMFVRESVTLTGEGPAARLQGLAVSSDLMNTLGVEMEIGRSLASASDLDGGPKEVVLTHALWVTRFGSNDAVLGQSIVLDQTPHEVVGVAPPGFEFPDGAVFGTSDVFLPIGGLVAGWTDRGSHPGIYVLGRLEDGVAFEVARDEATQLASRMAQLHSENEDAGIHMVSLLDEALGTLPQALLLMSISAGLVLLIGFANAAGLFLSRAVSAGRDKSVSQALGANRRDMSTELVVDGVTFGALSALTALGVAGITLRVFREDLSRYPQLEGLSLGSSIVSLITVGAVAGSILVSVLPWAGSLFRPAMDVTGAKAQLGLSPTRRRAQTTLVAGQIALAVLLVGSSTVLVRSFRVMATDAGGIDPQQVLALRTSLPEIEYEGPPTITFYGQLSERIRGLPSVSSVGGISTLPFSGAGSQSRMTPDDQALEEGIRTDVNVVLGNYFEAMGLQLLEGRTFGPEDRIDTPPVVVIDERLAARFWPNESALDKTVSGWGLQSARVVGVVGHVKNYGVTRESREELYMPHEQRPYLSMYVIIRSSREAEALVAPIREAAMGLDPNVPVVGGWPMADIVEGTVATPQLAARLGSTLSLLAALLAFLGAYALMAHSVGQRTRELGLRMALGARRSSLSAMVLRQGGRMTFIGAVAGLLAAFAGSSILEGFVFGISPRDPGSLIGGAGLVVALITFATYLPARRAARTDPLAALRAE